MNNDYEFMDWMKEVDACLDARCRLHSDDLADICYRDYFDDGLEADEVAGIALRNEGFPEDL